MTNIPTSTVQNVFRILLGLFMLMAGIGHLTIQREAFQAQVPNWLPFSKDIVVILSGIIEIGFGLGMIFFTRMKVEVGIALALFYIVVFPGNIAQYRNSIDAFGLDTDQKRFIRLFFQPVLILWALWCTGALKYLKKHFRNATYTSNTKR
jgi:uncharacterized membrane protein